MDTYKTQTDQLQIKL